MKHESLYTQFDAVFFEKTRLSIITVLYNEETVSYNKIKQIIGGSDGAVFAHLQKLQDAGYIAQKKVIVGKKMQTYYSLTASGKKELTRYLQFVSGILEGNAR